MKKTLVIIFTIVLCLALTGAAVALGGEGGIIKKDEATSAAETGKTNSAQKTDENTISAITPETLSAEDKALKAEIAKISDTKVDFRANKNQKFIDKEYKLKCVGLGARIGGTLLENTESSRITYALDNENYFVYDVNSGNLVTASIKSNAMNKTDSSITESQAENVAKKYLTENFNAEEYTLDKIYCNEQFGYFIYYSKHICGYKTSDSITLRVDFNGDIFYINVSTGMFDEFKIESIDETKLLEALEAKIGKDIEYTIGNQRIVVEDGKVMMEYSISPTDSRGFICLIPIE